MTDFLNEYTYPGKLAKDREDYWEIVSEEKDFQELKRKIIEADKKLEKLQLKYQKLTGVKYKWFK